MSDFLEQVVAERRAAVDAAKDRTPERQLLANAKPNLATSAGAAAAHGDAFTRALLLRKREGRLAVIAEVKRRSPALGSLDEGVDPAAQARRYTALGDAWGATAISVLTEPLHWGGSFADLAAVRDAVHVPVLCKDVIVSEYQIVQARSAGADAVLLIAEALTDGELQRFTQRARELNMGVLVEAHEPEAFGRAVACGARVVGANARDLRHPSTIDSTRARQLHSFVKSEQIFVAESGIESVDDARLLPSRVDAVLIGTALMRADDPAPLISGIAAIRRTTTVGVTLAER